MNIHRYVPYIISVTRIEIVFEIKQRLANREISLPPETLTINSSLDRRLDFKWPEMGRALDFEAWVDSNVRG